MSWLWWTLGGLVCFGLLVLAGAGLAWLMIAEKRRVDRIREEGSHTFGWLVQANTDLFEKGFMDLPALVLISPDE